MRKYVVCDPDKCLGCQICEFVCSAFKEKSVDPALSRIRIINLEPRGSIAIACLLCERAPCVPVCPTKALHKDTKGIIQVEEAKCTGCGWCFEACPFGAINWHSDKKVVTICDLCDGDPECVKLCPFEGALIYSTPEEIGHRARREAFENLLEELIKARVGGV